MSKRYEVLGFMGKRRRCLVTECENRKLALHFANDYLKRDNVSYVFVRKIESGW